MIRSAATGAFMGISASGAVTIANGDNAFLVLGASFLGLQSGNASTLLQIDVDAQQVILQSKTTKMVVNEKASSLFTAGTLAFGTSGNQAAEHATTAEAMVGLLFEVLTALGPFFTTAAVAAGPLTPIQVTAILTAALAALPTATYAPFIPGITAALQTNKVPGAIAGIGAPGLMIG